MIQNGPPSQRTFFGQFSIGGPGRPWRPVSPGGPPLPNCNSGQPRMNAAPERAATGGDGATAQSPPYEGLAPIYDFVMRHVDYVSWAIHVDSLLRKFGNGPGTLVDLALAAPETSPCSSASWVTRCRA